MSGGNSSAVPLEENLGQPVNLQDQTTRPIFVKFNEVQNSTTLSAPAVKGAYTITVTATTGFVDGRYIILFDPASKNFSFYMQVGAPVGNVITLDSPIDYAYPSGTNVDTCITNMNVDGSSTPRIFGLRGTGVIPGVDISVDFTRIRYNCLTSGVATLKLFGDLTALGNGLVIRKRNSDFDNFLNIKKNSEFPGINITSALNPAQGADGFVADFIFAGQENSGVAVRLPLGDDLEHIVQDKIDGLLSLEALAIGHLLSN